MGSIATAAAALLCLLPPAPAGAGVRTSVPLEAGAGISLEAGRELLLTAQVAAGDGWLAFTRRWCAPSVAWKTVQAAGGGNPNPSRGQRVRLPFELLSDAVKTRVLRAAFPLDAAGDSPLPAGSLQGTPAAVWVHSPGGSPLETWGEGLWEAALWFTGDGANFTRLTRSGPGGDPQLRAGETVVIPAELLRPGLRPLLSRAGSGPADWPRRIAALPPPSPASSSSASRSGELTIDPAADSQAAASEDAAPDATASGQDAGVPPPAAGSMDPGETALSYGSDSTGRFALYPLKPGEALYSSVVVRFTGRVDPDEVSEIAAELARVNGIPDVTAIPVGFNVKIPLELLEPEFLPPGDPLRADYDRTRAEARSFRNDEKARNLEGVHVILDAGHGGIDPGAMAHGLNEHEYVYDVMCRLKKKLEDSTGAVVHPIVRDRKTAYTVRNARSLPPDGAEEILTDPRHVNGDASDTTVGVNLRWYLANSILRHLEAEGVPADRVVFLSLHADSLHPSLRGGMVYIPGERYRRGTFGSSAAVYSRYREVREKSQVSFTRDDRLRSEGLSRELAEQIISALRRDKLAVHPDLPVRDRIIRRKRAWVPAILRANEVPAKVLIEIANLNNSTDANLLRDSKFRDRTAAALVDALTRYFAEP